MYQNGGWSGIEFFSIGAWPLTGVLPFLVWILFWKGWALYLAARRGEKIWFGVLLVVHTLGLLEIFYIFVIAKRDDGNKVAAEGNQKPVSNNHAQGTN